MKILMLRILLLMLIVFGAFDSIASPVKPLPFWNAKKAAKMLRVLRVYSVDASGKPIEDQSITLTCTMRDAAGVEHKVAEATSVTNSKGRVSFRRKIPQGSSCVLKNNEKVIHSFVLTDLKPMTTGFMSWVWNQEIRPKKTLVKNQVQTAAKHKLKVYFYYKEKRFKFKTILKKVSVQLTCLTPTGKVWTKTLKSTRFIPKVTFDEIPNGSQCFLKLLTNDCNAGVKGYYDFTENDHGIISEVRTHYNLDSCKKCKKCKKSCKSCKKCQKKKCKTCPLGDGGGGTPAFDPNGDNAGQLGGPEADERYRNLMWQYGQQDEHDHDAHPEHPSEQATEPTTYSETLRFKLQSCDGNTVLRNQEVSITSPDEDESLVLKSDAQGVVTVPANEIVKEQSYFVSLGSDQNPLATRTVAVPIQWNAAVDIPEVCFDIGALRVEFNQGSAVIDSSRTNEDDFKKIAAALTQFPDLRITIHGHTNSDGSAENNFKLSLKRVQAVRDHFVKVYGVDESRIQVKAFGETQLIRLPDGKEDKNASRRVEVKPYFGDEEGD